MTAPLHAVEHHIILLERQRVRPPEAGVEIGRVLRNFGQGIVDLPVDDGFRVRVAILESKPGAAAKRHLPVAVEGASRIDANGERAHGSVAAPSAGKKVSERRLDRRVALIVPVNAQDEITPAHVGGRDPYLLDCALPFDVAKQQGLARARRASRVRSSSRVRARARGSRRCPHRPCRLCPSRPSGFPG